MDAEILRLCVATQNVHGFPLVEFYECGVADGEDMHTDAQGFQIIDGERVSVLRHDCVSDPATCLHHVFVGEQS